MKKEKLIFTTAKLEASLRKKAEKIAKQETGETNRTEGIRIALRAFKLRK